MTLFVTDVTVGARTYECRYYPQPADRDAGLGEGLEIDSVILCGKGGRRRDITAGVYGAAYIGHDELLTKLEDGCYADMRGREAEPPVAEES